MASMAASWTEFPKTASGCVMPTRVERGDLAFVGRYVEQTLCDDAVNDLNLGGEYAVSRDVEAGDTLLNDPVAGRS